MSDPLLHPKQPTMWNEVIFFSCPYCVHEFRLESLELEKKYSDYYGSEMYFARCPNCGKEHVAFG